MTSNKPDTTTTTTILQYPPKNQEINIKVWGLSLISVFPWAENLKIPTFFNKKLKKHAQLSQTNLVGPGITYSTVRFRPYVSKVPWHTGPRAFLSQLFPRYGHYCGPNWSSGKDGGSLLWDKRPIDWLDYCCYCHDMGYDSHDQSELLKADLAFLECLERPHMATRGDVHVAHLYKTMCVSGLRGILIPYRQHLVKLKSGQLSLGFGWLSNMKWKGWNAHKEAR
ncbi:hypothetical protein Lser_V15G04833 [Lactuca serriola]